MKESVDDFIDRLTEVERHDLLEGMRLREKREHRSKAVHIAALLHSYLTYLGYAEDAAAVNAISNKLKETFK